MSNNLESKLTEQQRPSFLKRIARYAGIGALSLLAIACDKNKPTTPSGPGTTPTPVSQRIQVYNSDGTNLGAANFEGTSGQNMTITYADLATKGINTQRSDLNYFVARQENAGETLGAYVAHTTNGSVTFTPSSAVGRVIWLMNNTNGADYAGVWNAGLGRNGIMGNARYANAIRLTAQNNTRSQWQIMDGDMSNIVSGVELLNQAWSVGDARNRVRLASITYLGDGGSGDMKIGIGISSESPNGSGVSFGNAYIINPKVSNTNSGITNSAGEAFELLYEVDDLLGIGSAGLLFGSALNTQMLPVGMDYLRFAALMSR